MPRRRGPRQNAARQSRGLPAPPNCWSSCWPSHGASTGSPPRSRLREVSPWSLRVAGSAIGAVDAFRRRHHHRPQTENPARRAPACDGCRLLQRRSIPNPFRFRAALRRDLARHHHHLFDADLDHDAQHRRARRKAEPHPHHRVLFVRGGPFGPALAAVHKRFSTLRVLFAWLRAELVRGDGLYQMGQGQNRAAGQRGLAIAVRPAVHRRRYARVRRFAAPVADQ